MLGVFFNRNDCSIRDKSDPQLNSLRWCEMNYYIIIDVI